MLVGHEDLNLNVSMLRFSVALGWERVWPHSVDVFFLSKRDGVRGPWRSETQLWHAVIQCRSGIETRSGATSVDMRFP